MKIGVVGCGALGSFYGAKLHRDGQAVHFLLRSDYEIVRRRGVRVLSPEGDFHVQPRPARNPQEIGVCDLVVVALKPTANDQFEQFIPRLIGSSTAILTLQNGLGNEARLAESFGAQKVLGGVCYVCLNRIEPGVIEHLAHGKVVLGEYQRWPEPRTHDIASMFRHAGVPCKVTENLERARWEKLAWNIPFNGLGVASVAGYDVAQGTFRKTRVRAMSNHRPITQRPSLGTIGSGVDARSDHNRQRPGLVGPGNGGRKANRSNAKDESLQSFDSGRLRTPPAVGNGKSFSETVACRGNGRCFHSATRSLVQFLTK
jgi:2-dehydropantoate 2-reductase